MHWIAVLFRSHKLIFVAPNFEIRATHCIVRNNTRPTKNYMRGSADCVANSFIFNWYGNNNVVWDWFRSFEHIMMICDFVIILCILVSHCLLTTSITLTMSLTHTGPVRCVSLLDRAYGRNGAKADKTVPIVIVRNMGFHFSVHYCWITSGKYAKKILMKETPRTERKKGDDNICCFSYRNSICGYASSLREPFSVMSHVYIQLILASLSPLSLVASKSPSALLFSKPSRWGIFLTLCIPCPFTPFLQASFRLFVRFLPSVWVLSPFSSASILGSEETGAKSQKWLFSIC